MFGCANVSMSNIVMEPVMHMDTFIKTDYVLHFSW